MKKLPGLLIALLGLVTLASAQEDHTRLFTRPTVPTQASLDRYNLKLGWEVLLPVDGRRDGLFSVQPLGSQVFVQLRSGTIVALDADTGATQWRTRVGTSYLVSHPLGFNDRTVFVIRGLRLFALDRGTGQTLWEIDLPNAAVAEPVADETPLENGSQALYVCVAPSRLYVYELASLEQKPGKAPSSKPGEGPNYPIGKSQNYGSYVEDFRGRGVSAIGSYSGTATFNPRAMGAHQPRVAWWVDAPQDRLEYPPLLSQGLVTMPGSDTLFYPALRSREAPAQPYRIQDRLSAPIGQHGNTAYLATSDSSLYAVDLQSGRTHWRLAIGGATIRQKPAVTDDDVYISAEPKGLSRVLRASGEVQWTNPNAYRFLSQSKRLVFAADRRGQLLILDRGRGTQVASLDTSAYVVPIANELTDRCYLGANNGQLICLYDRTHPTPWTAKTWMAAKKPAAKPALMPLDGGKGPEMMPDKEMKKDPEKEMKKEEKKEADKEEKKEEKKD